PRHTAIELQRVTRKHQLRERGTAEWVERHVREQLEKEPDGDPKRQSERDAHEHEPRADTRKERVREFAVFVPEARISGGDASEEERHAEKLAEASRRRPWRAGSLEGSFDDFIGIEFCVTLREVRGRHLA